MAEAKILVEPVLDVEGTFYQVLRYELVERISQPTQLSCELTQLDVEATAPADLIGKTAKLKLRRTDGSQDRELVGRVVVAERRADADDVRTIHLEVAPVPWALSKRADCRVFQNLTVEDIAKQVFEAAGVAADKQDWRLTAAHPEREYTVQYRETDLEFLQRIFAEEGVYYAIHHDDGLDKIILGDDPTGIGDISGTTKLPYHYGHGFEESFDFVTRIAQVHRVTTDKVMLRDYNHAKPKLKVEATVESEEDGSHVLELYDFPARGAEPADMERFAKITLDGLMADRNVLRGEAGVLSLRPGLRFTLEEHPYAALNQEYMVTAVRIFGSTPRVGAQGEALGGTDQRYGCLFEAVPTTTRYAPPYLARATDIVGLQTAFTTGPPGEEIHVDDTGAVKIRYHWDRLGPDDDTSSLWCRTSQLALGDSMLLPRMKWEVAVDHYEGDPDRPLVMARMYNAHAPPPYDLPGEAVKSALQTATSPGGGSVNEFRMSDGKGSEEMFFNASKDMAVHVKNNTTESVANNCTREVGSNQTKDITNSITVNVGGSQKVTVGANQKVNVETRYQDEVGGDHTLSIGGNRNMMIGGDHKRDVGGDSTLSVGGMNIDLVVGSVTHDTLGSFTHNVGAALIDITPADRFLLVGGSISETAGAAKIIGTMAGRGVAVGGSYTVQVGGAIINKANGDRAETAGATYTEIAAGAQIVKANNISIEADGMINLVMGASIVSINPAMVTIMGASVKMDGTTSDLGALIIDN